MSCACRCCGCCCHSDGPFDEPGSACVWADPQEQTPKVPPQVVSGPEQQRVSGFSPGRTLKAVVTVWS